MKTLILEKDVDPHASLLAGLSPDDEESEPETRSRTRTRLETQYEHVVESEARFEDILDDFEGDLSAEAERLNWYGDYHAKACKKMKVRFSGEALLMIVLSLGELFWLVQQHVWWYSHPIYGRRHRWPVFIYCRLFMVFCSIMWYYVAEVTAFIRRRPAIASRLILATYCFYLAAMYLSYDAFTFSTCDEYRSHTKFYTVFKAPRDQIFTLSFVLLFFATTRRHFFLFKHSLIFIPLALFLTNIQDMTTLFRSRVPELDNAACPEGWESNWSIIGKALVFMQALLNVAIAYTEETNSKHTFISVLKAERTQKRTQHILATLMPPLVVEELKMQSMNASPPSHKYRHATIAQSDLCGFTKLASSRTPQEVVQFMGELFGAFDRLTDKHGVYKVETIGDAYVAGMAEGPLTKTNLPVNVILFGLDMVRAVDEWAKAMGVTVACRVGIHYGECIGGIVGCDMQRYHLFGDLLTVLEILESTSEEGRVQVSKACKEEVERQLREDSSVKITREETPTFRQRDDEMLKTSKGEAHSYDEVGGRTYNVQSNVELRRTMCTIAPHKY